MSSRVSAVNTMLFSALTAANTLLFSAGAAFLLGRYPSISATTSSIVLNTTTCFLIISLLRLIWALYVYPHYLSPLRHLPKPPDKPSLFMGHAPQMQKAGNGTVLRSWAIAVPNQGIIRYLDFFNLERLAIVSPPALAEVLVHKCYEFEKPASLRKGISRILGMGLFLAEGEVHKIQRKNLMPAFAYRHVKNLYPMFWHKSCDLVNAVSDSTRIGKVAHVEVNEWASRATLDIIGEGGFGQTFNAIKDPNNELSQTYRSIFRPGKTGQILGIMGFLLPQWIVRRLPFLRNDKMKRGSDLIRAFCRSSIESKRSKDSLETESRPDILSVAMTSGAFSDEELTDQMMTFLAAGHETTASALTWAIYVLAKHPDIQTRLHEEVITRLPHSLIKPNADMVTNPHAPEQSDPSSSVTAETFEHLPYLTAVCREVLRLYPPVALTIRVAVKDTLIAGQPIPKGTTIILPPWAVNADPKFWGADAAEFKPERWLQQRHGYNTDVEKEGRKSTNYDFLTFLHGPRSCIGQTFAMGELLCLVAAWVIAFDTALKDKDWVPVIRGGITAKPDGGLHVRLVQRGL